ncbi:MAG: cupin domain-containing protein [Fluviibacter phosphoraccumulans]
MSPPLTNLLSDLPEKSDEELFTTLFQNPNCRIERIVSFGQSSPEDFWYDQEWDEWVLLLQGYAELDLAGQVRQLTPGEHVLIPAGLRHRVIHTAKDQPTVWLAIHFNEPTKS